VGHVSYVLLIRLPAGPERMPYDAYGIQFAVQVTRIAAAVLREDADTRRMRKERIERLDALIDEAVFWRLRGVWWPPPRGAAPSTTHPNGEAAWRILMETDATPSRGDRR
jgi:hypothetical protein